MSQPPVVSDHGSAGAEVLRDEQLARLRDGLLLVMAQWGNQPQSGNQPQPGHGAPQWGTPPQPGVVPPPGFQAQPSYGSQPPPKPPKKRGGCLKAGGIVVGIIVIIIIIAAAISSGGGKGSTSSNSNTTQAAGTTTPKAATAPTTTQAAAPTTTAADPTTTFTDQFGAFAPVSKSGSGSSVITLPAGAKAGIVTATYSGSANFVISTLDASNKDAGDLMVNTIGKYSGTTAFGLSSFGGDAAKLKIDASGPWTVNIQPIASAPTLTVPAKATGDKVFIYSGQADSWAITNSGQSNFVVTFIGDTSDLLVNEIGSYSGTVPVTGGPAIIVVESDGAWTISKG